MVMKYHLMHGGPTTAANQLGYFVDNGIIPGPNDGSMA